MAQKNFDPDAEVDCHPVSYGIYSTLLASLKTNTDGFEQDGSGWTPLMIAASLKDAEGDPIIELLLQKGADVNVKSVTGQVCCLEHFPCYTYNSSFPYYLHAHG